MTKRLKCSRAVRDYMGLVDFQILPLRPALSRAPSRPRLCPQHHGVLRKPCGLRTDDSDDGGRSARVASRPTYRESQQPPKGWFRFASTFRTRCSANPRSGFPAACEPMERISRPCTVCFVAASLTRCPIGSWAGRSGSGGPAMINKGCRPMKAGRGEDRGERAFFEALANVFWIRPMPRAAFPKLAATDRRSSRR
jgi:hypothetical protein